jgi:hypothetical protein
MQTRIHFHLINQCRRFYQDILHNPSDRHGRRPAHVYVSDTNTVTIRHLTKSFMESFNSIQFPTYPYINPHTKSFHNDYFQSDMETFTQTIFDGEPRSQIFDYSAAMKPSAVPLIANRVALPSFLHSVPMLSVLPKSIIDYYSHTNTNLFRSSSVESPSRPAHAFASNSEYTALLKRMKAVGMINFTSAPRCVNGCFGVPKPDGEIRLVIDAQPANALFCLPPHVDLPTPANIAAINTSNLYGPFYTSKCDLSNFYHHVALPIFMQPYFALPAVRASDIDVESDSDYIFPMCTTMPMGWSHAVYVAQAIHLHILYSQNTLNSTDNILFSNDLLLNRTLHFIYIDDLTLVSPSLAHALKLHATVIRKYSESGFIVKQSKVIEPTSERVEVLGVELCGNTHTLAVAPKKMTKLQSTTASLLKLGSCSGHTLSRIIGSWIWPCLIRRPSLSIFRQCYRFISISNHRVFTLWPSVIRELALVSFLAPLLQLSLNKHDFKYLIATNASKIGGGLVSTSLHTLSNMFLTHDAPVLHSVQPHMRAQLSPDELDMHEQASSSVSRYYWKTIASYKWFFPAHINMYEMNALQTGVKWASKFPDAMGSRLHALTDSASVLYSTAKGRSSSQLSSSLQRLAANLFAFDIVLTTYWIPSIYNPADKPSRRQ